MSIFKSSLESHPLVIESEGENKITTSELLLELGPLVSVRLGVNQRLADELKSSGNEIPAPIEITALIDTGAKTSCIEDNLARYLQLPIRYEAKVSTPTLVEATVDVYSDAKIEIKNSGGMIFEPRGIVSSTLDQFGVGILLGRDFLAEGDFNYKGPKGEFTISH